MQTDAPAADLLRRLLLFRGREMGIRALALSQRRGYWLGLAALAIATIAAVLLDPLLGIFVAGIAAGALSRDIGMFRRSKMTWPVLDRVLDWHKVEVELSGIDRT